MFESLVETLRRKQGVRLKIYLVLLIIFGSFSVWGQKDSAWREERMSEWEVLCILQAKQN